MIEVVVKSKKTGDVKRGHFTARELLQRDEEDIVSTITDCDCQQTECNCNEEWEEYVLFFNDGF